MLSNAIVTALFPQLSELYTQQGVEGLKDACKAATRYSVLTSFPIIIGLAVLAFPIVILFGGWEYRDAGLPLTVLCLAGLPIALGVALTSTLTTLERTKTVSIITIISIIFTSVVAFVNLAYFYPVLGLTGLAWARIVSAVVAFGLSAYALRRVFSLPFDKEALWKASAASLFMTAAIFLLDVARQVLTSQGRQFLLPPLHWLPLYVVVGGVAYFFGLAALKAIKKRDIELIQEYLPRGFKRMVPWLERLARVD
jgi:O-antigen/teichoic acid export membrane protein